MRKFKDITDFFFAGTEEVKSLMHPDDVETVKNCEDVIEYHHTLGRQVRNHFGLWNVNKHLGHADTVSHQFLVHFRHWLNDPSIPPLPEKLPPVTLEHED